MKLIGQILLVCVLLSVVKALVVLIAVAIVLLLVWGIIYHTPETVGLIALSLLLEGLQVHPIATVGVIMLVGCIVLLARTKGGDDGKRQDS